MSYYVVLIKAQCSGFLNLYAISTAANPEAALAQLQTYSPVPCELVHSIRAQNRTDYLEKTLHIKFRHKQHHSFWFMLDENDRKFITSITAENFFQISGLIAKTFAPPAPPPPKVSADELSDLIAENIALAERLSK